MTENNLYAEIDVRIYSEGKLKLLEHYVALFFVIIVYLCKPSGIKGK